MKVLHTSDWHIGRRLKEHDRFDEFRKFFAWLEDLITRENIDVLLVAGDIFDNTTPSVQAQDIYYNFLSRLAKSSCRHTVIISGNHDSPAFIDAPSELLKLNNIHVVGQVSENPEDEIITLYDSNNKPELIVCAVPYLRDRDVRTSDNNNNLEQALRDGINHHYERVFNQAASYSGVPVIAMGHLFIHNGKVAHGEGIRSLYVGTALELESSIFPENIIYTALGHLHSPQTAGRNNIRYSGSPVAMTFGECETQKSVTIIELDSNNNSVIREVPVPVFQRLERFSGDINEIISDLRQLALTDESIWLEITYTGREVIGDLQERFNQVMKDFPNLEILSIYNEGGRASQENESLKTIPEGLENIKPLDMLTMCFDENKTPKEQRTIFANLYQEILREMEINY
ncbi:MAG: exonuclease SbcCD subunit D C-terminal domain-containing protein [Synergistaceae bacterium]|nr:exonuclease SbcCD subunit D C-terminal domain-containing protein [Synergistaceae bacterium]